MSNNMRIIDYKEKYLKYKKKYTNSKINYVGGANGLSPAKALLNKYIDNLQEDSTIDMENLEQKINSSNFIYLKKEGEHIVIFLCNQQHTGFGEKENKSKILEMIEGKKIFESHKGRLKKSNVFAHGIVLGPS